MCLLHSTLQSSISIFLIEKKWSVARSSHTGRQDHLLPLTRLGTYSSDLGPRAIYADFSSIHNHHTLISQPTRRMQLRWFRILPWEDIENEEYKCILFSKPNSCCTLTITTKVQKNFTSSNTYLKKQAKWLFLVSPLSWLSSVPYLHNNQASQLSTTTLPKESECSSPTYPIHPLLSPSPHQETRLTISHQQHSLRP